LNLISSSAKTENTASYNKRWQKWLWAAPPLAYLLLALVLTWPLALHLADNIPRGNPDSWQNIWNFWWMRHSLFEERSNPFWTQYLFYPYRSLNQPLSLYFHTLQPVISLPGAIFSYWLNYALTYNLVILIGFVSTGWTMFALTRYNLQAKSSKNGNLPDPNPLSNSTPLAKPATIEQSQTQNLQPKTYNLELTTWNLKLNLAAFVAGAFYTFSVFHWHNLAQGQTSVFWLQWLSLYILLLQKSLAPLPAQSRSLTNPLLAGLVLALCTYSDLYYTLYLLLYSAIFWLWLSWRSFSQHNNNLYKWPEVTKRLGLSLLLWLILAAPLLIGMLTHRNDPAIKYSEGIEIAILQSAALPSFFIPSRGFERAWLPFFLGYSTLALAGLGLWRSKKAGLGWLILTLLALLMTLGPYLRLEQSQPVEEAVKNLPLPYLLFNELPLVNNSRSPIRFMALAQLGLGLLAGWGLLWLIEQVNRWRTGRRFAATSITGLILLIFCLETNVLPLSLEKLPQPALFTQIKPEPDYALLELPLTGHYIEDTRRMYYQALHQHPMSSGYIARKVYDYQREPASPFGYFFDIGPAKPEPIFLMQEQATPLRILNYYNFGYVINYRDDYKAGAAWQFNDAENYLQSLFRHGPNYQDELMTAYRLSPDPARIQPILWRTANFSEAETRSDGLTFRWAGAEGGAIDLINPAAGMISLKLAAWSFGKEDDLQFLLNGQEIGRLHLGTQPQDYSLALKLPTGPLRLELRSFQPARSPGGNDKRLLTFALAKVGV